jgi:hypothetical protein
MASRQLPGKFKYVFTFIASVFLSENWILIASSMETEKSEAAFGRGDSFYNGILRTLLAFSNLPMVAMEIGRWFFRRSQFKNQGFP